MAGTCVEVYRLFSEVVVICSYVGYLQISWYVGKAVLCLTSCASSLQNGVLCAWSFNLYDHSADISKGW